MKSIYIVFLLSIVLSQGPDQIPQFPWWPSYSFQTYAGYLSLTPKRQAFYVFIQSQGNPATDPVILWLNGGPGCSSLLGLTTEIGPFYMNMRDTNFTQTINQYAWNKNANIIFLESPTGVGFSTNTDSEYVYNDVNTGSDNYNALLAFFAKAEFSKFLGNSFYIAGESYGGMYIPYTAMAILNGNKAGLNAKINLKGIAIGDGVLETNPSGRAQSLYEYLKRVHMITPDLYKMLQSCANAPTAQSCQWAENQISSTLTNLNAYNIYQPCYHVNSESKKRTLTQSSGVTAAENNIPCEDYSNLINYFNNPTVQQALRITGSPTWSPCNMQINTNYQQNTLGSLYLLPQIKQFGVKILFYSGDQDSAVSFVESLNSLAKLNMKTIATQVPWADAEGQLGGWKTEYDLLTFQLIRGSGHMVPQDQRQRAFQMISEFVVA